MFYRTPLIIATEKGNIEVVRYLINHPKIDLDVKYIFIFI